MQPTEQMQRVAEAWGGRAQEIAEDMYRVLAERIPVVQKDPELAALTLGSCSSNVEAILSMMRSGIPSSAAEAPVTALEHARAMAARGAEVDDTLRFYRLGHGYFLSRWTDDLRATFADPEAVLAVLRDTTDYTVEYVDIVSSRVSAEHLAERERRQRRAALVRADLVQALLIDDPADTAAAERTLAHRLAGPQLAFVCWSAAPSAQLERAVTTIAEALGSARPLLIPDGAEALVAWVSTATAALPAPHRVGSLLQPVAPGVSVAFGAVGTGLPGFRATRDQAARARRVAELLDAPRPQVVRYEDVALLDLLSQDLDAARAHVHRELAGLADPAPAFAAVRETVSAVLAPRGGIAQAARAQGLHRNTVLQRVRRAEALRGRPLDEHADELYAALRLTQAFPSLLQPAH